MQPATRTVSALAMALETVDSVLRVYFAFEEAEAGVVGARGQKCPCGMT